jgi:pilus assembly protein CpaD
MAFVSFVLLPLAGCRHIDEDGPRVAGWARLDASDRHPILVSQEPATLLVRVSRDADGLTHHQRGEVLGFTERYRAADAGNSRLVISAPGGSSNEVASMYAVREIREMLIDNGFPETAVSVEAYDAEGQRHPPIRVSYLAYVANPPPCGNWPTNLGREPDNLPYENFGCATQRNLAVMVANPADLLGPRSETPRSSERRSYTWDRYIQGQTTGAQKSEDEKINVQNGN